MIHILPSDCQLREGSTLLIQARLLGKPQREGSQGRLPGRSSSGGSQHLLWEEW